MRTTDTAYLPRAADPPQPAPAPEAPAPAEEDPFELDDEDFELDDLVDESAEVDDPLEDVNRVIFEVNDVADRFVLGPIARTYGFIVPGPAKEALQRAYLNLRSPARFANDLLQGEIGDAGTTGGRFLINSTIGLAGLFDPAEDFGLEHHPSDFGQTLHAYGVGSGPYVVLPLLGPSTARDGVGFAVDGFLDPLGYILPSEVNLGLAAGQAIVTREAFDEQIENIRETSIDPYATLRSVYIQNRNSQLER